jgi:hypothetical protein
MNATSGYTVTDYERHKLKMLLWQADIHEKNGEKQEAAKIRGWVADFLSEQSRVVRSVWREVAQTRPSHGQCDLLAKRSLHGSKP